MKQTPYIIINEKKLKSNIKRMNQLAENNNVNLRPHIKTHKIPYIAKMQIEEGAVGITVAKITEAKVMASHGIDNIFIAYPVVTMVKAMEICQLNNQITTLIVGVDSLVGANVLNDAAEKNGKVLQVRMEVDTGLQRTGVKSEIALQLAVEISKLKNLYLQGIYTFKGAVYQGLATLDTDAAGKEEGELIVEIANQIREAGIPLEDVSVGSTPTAKSVSEIQGVTEIRPGTYVFNDAMQVGLGVSNWDDCAAHVVSTVVSKTSENYVVIDGGSKTFATDVQPGGSPLNLNGFGAVKEYADAVFIRMNEEHGIVETKTGQPEIGEEVSIIPNHICSTVNLHNSVYLEKENHDYIELTVEARGMLQ